MSGARRNVLHLIDTTGPGGAETIYLGIASGMRDRGWSCRAVVVGPGWVLDGLNRAGIQAHLIATSGRLDLSYLQGIRSVVRDHDVDLIHAHLYSPGVYASVVGASTGIPVVATFHGESDTARGGWSRQLRYRAIGRQAVVVCVSESLARDLRSAGRYSLPDVRVIHNGVDPGTFATAKGSEVRHEHKLRPDTFLVGSLGNLRPAKDFPTLLQAAALLGADRRIAFAIVGQRTDPLFTELMHLRNVLHLQDKVSFWGFRSDVPEVLAAFDMLAISSSSEGFSLAAVQAMAAGKPVVATRCGGPEEIVTDGVDGMLVPPRSPDALAAAISRICDDTNLRATLAAQASRTASERFSLEAMLNGYEDLYDELLGNA